jgi:hypothetical protein
MRVGSGEWRDTLVKELETGFSRQQLTDARSLIDEESRFVGKHGVDYVFIGKTADEDGHPLYSYLTSVYKMTCSCAARQYEKNCYHLAAAIALTVYGSQEASSEL